MSSLYKINLDIDKEYIPMINDLVRMGIIQIVAQTLFYMISPDKISLISEAFLKTLIFICISELLLSSLLLSSLSSSSFSLSSSDPEKILNTWLVDHQGFVSLSDTDKWYKNNKVLDYKKHPKNYPKRIF